MTDVTHLQHSHAAAGILGIAGILLALWSASNYVAAFMRASNVIYDVPEGRPIWKTAPIRLGVTLVTMILLVASAVIVVVNGRPSAESRERAQRRFDSGHRLGHR